MNIQITYSEGWICGSIPKLHIHTQGKTWEEFLANIQEAIDLYRDEESQYQKSLIKRPRFILQPSALYASYL